ncbi:PAS domain-containing sensor histidine kinase [Neopusillimonas maritima]|jgi:PAS domain S-box-containing protein|uniref:histidine kinase n=1 Tax=Neopusillimonas maritima TaxID=2026239 RepID=A0ABX9MU05_9BURK|nr:PAS domain-containing hybrid sensor histidine kinase/response regulator [Neopusillimonas maritima]RII82374.1 hypothetical protein CJO09_10770 [Neopusillimonas maritima]
MKDLSLLFERHPDPMWVYDLETLHFLEVNQAAVRRYGYTRGEFLAMTIKDIRPTKDVEALEQNIALISEGIDSAGVWTHLNKAGEQLLVDITSEVLEFRGRKAELVCARDVTDRVRLQSEARTTEERFKLIARATHDVIWDWNLDTDQVWWNENIETVFGHKLAELEPDSTSWSNRIHPDDLKRVVNSIHVVQEGKGSTWVSEYRFLNANGKVHHVVDRGFVLRNQNGKATRMLGSMMDITEQRELTQLLAQAQKMDAIGQLTGGVAHDFNNLLTVILGNTELIHELVEDNEELSGLAAMTVSAAKRGAELTQRLLAFARRQALEPKLLNLNQLVSEMENLFRRTLSETIDLRFILTDELWACEADPHQLESALLNLIINARDAMPQGGRLTVETDNVSLEEKSRAAAFDLPTGKYVVLSVSDTGHGISADVLNQVFEPFFTTKPPGKGTGLGLSMVYGFLKQSGGQAKIYSEPGEGTTVKLYFPRSQTRETPRVFEQHHTVAPRGTETILVVEDDELVRTHVVSLLTGLGYRVIETTNGPDALIKLQQHPEIALLFTDIIMPGGLNGRQLADTALARYPRLRVLYTSGYTENAIVHHGRLDPGIALLGKPYTRQALAHKLRAVLEHAQ